MKPLGRRLLCTDALVPSLLPLHRRRPSARTQKSSGANALGNPFQPIVLSDEAAVPFRLIGTSLAAFWKDATPLQWSPGSASSQERSPLELGAAARLSI
jgi:hypothetical protein